jgi:hypothetical protein
MQGWPLFVGTCADILGRCNGMLTQTRAAHNRRLRIHHHRQADDRHNDRPTRSNRNSQTLRFVYTINLDSCIARCSCSGKQHICFCAGVFMRDLSALFALLEPCQTLKISVCMSLREFVIWEFEEIVYVSAGLPNYSYTCRLLHCEANAVVHGHRDALLRYPHCAQRCSF